MIVRTHLFVEQANVEENISHMLVLRQVIVFKGHENLVELHEVLLVIFARLEHLQCKLADSSVVHVEIVEKLNDVI